MAELKKLITQVNLEMSGDTKLYMVSAKQGDKATRYVIAKLLNNGAEYAIPEGTIVVVNVKKPDGKRVYNTCEASGSEVTIELTNQILAASGTAYCDVEIRTENDMQVITSASFTIEIEESMRSDKAILSSNEYTELERREEIRKQAEEQRRQNEEARQEAEGQRQQNEEARQEAEGQRQQNEEARQEAEGQRQQNEEARQEAEGQREQNTSQAIQDVNAAKQNCEKITIRAENALQSQEQLEETLNTALGIKESVERDKAEIDKVIEENAYTLPVASASVRGGVKTGYTANGKNYPVQLSNEQMYVNVPWANTTYSAATQVAAGLMSAADKKKLDGVATGANVYTHPNSGVAAGTYRSLTVNTQGHVTGGSNPVLAVAQGGTGATTAAQALANIGAAAASHTHNYAAASHTHNYAGSASAGGTANRALGDSDGAQINTAYRKKSEGSVVKIQASAPSDTTALWAY